MLGRPEGHWDRARGWTRRETLGALAGALLGATGCSRPKATRTEVLGTLSRDLSKADLDELDRGNARLLESLQRLGSAPGEPELADARARFRESLLAWERASCFPNVALTNSHALLRARFWPIRAVSVQKLLLGTEELSEAQVSELGVDRKGLFALELLLFPSPGTDGRAPVERADSQGARARSLSLAYAENVASCAKKVLRGAAAEPVDAHTQLTQILSHMSTILGSVASGRLSKAFEPNREACASEVKGCASGTSISILRALVAGTERVYQGPKGMGLGTLVAESAPDCDEHLRALFRAALDALGRADETSASPGVLTAAQAAVRSLDVALEIELPSALGVTLLFGGNDAD